MSSFPLLVRMSLLTRIYKMPSSNPRSIGTGCCERNKHERWIHTLDYGCLRASFCQLGCWNGCFYLHHVDKRMQKRCKKNMGAATQTNGAHFLRWQLNMSQLLGKKTRTLSMTYDTFRDFTTRVVPVQILTSCCQKAPIRKCVLSWRISNGPVSSFFRPATVLDTNTNHSNRMHRRLLTACHLPPEKSLVDKYWHIWHDEHDRKRA